MSKNYIISTDSLFVDEKESIKCNKMKLCVKTDKNLDIHISNENDIRQI